MKTLSGVLLIGGNFLLFLGALVWGLRHGPASPDWFWLAFCLYPGVSAVYYGDSWDPDGVDASIHYHLLVSGGSTLVLAFGGLLALLGLIPFWIPMAAAAYLLLFALEYFGCTLYFQERSRVTS